MASIDQIRASDGSGNANTATVQSSRSGGASTIVVDTVLGINDTFMATMGTPHTFTDPVTSETITVISEATAVDFAGHVDGSNLEIDTIAPGYTDGGSEVGDIVIVRPTTQWSDNVADVLAVSHADDGSIETDTIAEKTAAAGVTIDGLLIKDSKLAENDSVVTSNITNAAVTPAKRSGGFYAGTFTLSGTGNKAITGVGFTPKLVVFDWVANSSATADNNTSGWMTSTAQFAKWSSTNAGANTSARNAYTDGCLAMGSSASSTATEKASYVSMDSDGFTINVSANTNGTWAFVAYG